MGLQEPAFGPWQLVALGPCLALVLPSLSMPHSQCFVPEQKPYTFRKRLLGTRTLDFTLAENIRRCSAKILDVLFRTANKSGIRDVAHVVRLTCVCTGVELATSIILAPSLAFA